MTIIIIIILTNTRLEGEDSMELDDDDSSEDTHVNLEKRDYNSNHSRNSALRTRTLYTRSNKNRRVAGDRK